MTGTLRMSSFFTQSASQLPKEARAKLPKVLNLLTTDPRHPSLHLKKIEGVSRKDVYECRLDNFWRIIMRQAEGLIYDLMYVGAHDEAIHHGLMVQEPRATYIVGLTPNMADLVEAFLAGDEDTISFREITLTELDQLSN